MSRISPKVNQLVSKWTREIQELQQRKQKAVEQGLAVECVNLELGQEAYSRAIMDLQEAFCHDLYQERMESCTLQANISDLKSWIDYLNERGKG